MLTCLSVTCRCSSVSAPDSAQIFTRNLQSHRGPWIQNSSVQDGTVWRACALVCSRTAAIPWKHASVLTQECDGEIGAVLRRRRHLRRKRSFRSRPLLCLNRVGCSSSYIVVCMTHTCCCCSCYRCCCRLCAILRHCISCNGIFCRLRFVVPRPRMPWWRARMCVWRCRRYLHDGTCRRISTSCWVCRGRRLSPQHPVAGLLLRQLRDACQQPRGRLPRGDTCDATQRCVGVERSCTSNLQKQEVQTGLHHAQAAGWRQVRAGAARQVRAGYEIWRAFHPPPSRERRDCDLPEVHRRQPHLVSAACQSA